MPPFLQTLQKILTKWHTPCQARIVDGTLIASFPDAKPPCVWQQDVSEIHSAVLTQQEDTWSLGVFEKKSSTSSKDIAYFSDIEAAQKALKTVSSTLLKQNASFGSGFQKFSNFLWNGLKLSLLLLFFVLVFRFFTRPIGPSPSVGQEISDGAPVPADQILSLPEN